MGSVVWASVVSSLGSLVRERSEAIIEHSIFRVGVFVLSLVSCDWVMKCLLNPTNVHLPKSGYAIVYQVGLI